MPEKTLAHGQKIHRPGQMAVVSKNPFFSFNLLPLSGAVWWNVDNHSICPLPHSNYDKKYYQLWYHIPMDSSMDLEEHPYGLEDPQSLPP